MFIEESIHRQSTVPSHCQLKVTLEDKVEKEECSEGDLITPGATNWQRKVHTCIGEKVDADRLIAGETFTPSGDWSSYPPHKHDSYDPTREAPYEEVYFFLTIPAKGFGIQRIYIADESLSLPPFFSILGVEGGSEEL